MVDNERKQEIEANYLIYRGHSPPLVTMKVLFVLDLGDLRK